MAVGPGLGRKARSRLGLGLEEVGLGGLGLSSARTRRARPPVRSSELGLGARHSGGSGVGTSRSGPPRAAGLAAFGTGSNRDPKPAHLASASRPVRAVRTGDPTRPDEAGRAQGIRAPRLSQIDDGRSPCAGRLLVGPELGSPEFVPRLSRSTLIEAVRRPRGYTLGNA